MLKEQSKITFKTITNSSVDDWGNVVEESSERTIFAFKKSANQNEFYKANTNGLKPHFVFEVYKKEYNNEQTLFFEGVEHSIIRIYQNALDKIELVCERKLKND